VRTLTAFLIAVPATTSAQQPRLRPVTWSLTVPATPRSGATGTVTTAQLRARIDPGWHLYSLTQPAGGPRATLIEVVGEPPFRLGGAIGRPAPDTIPDANFGIMSEIYDDSVTFRLPIAARSPLPGGRRRLVVAITYQACTSRLCLTPRTDSVSVTVRSTR